MAAEPTQAPTFEWAISAGGTLHDKTRGIAVDREGNVLLTGEFTGTATFGEQTLTAAGAMDFFMAKVDPHGKFAWVRSGGGDLIDRGYAVATFYSGDIDPDRPDFTDGVHPHFFPTGQSQRVVDSWGTIAAWAWGIHRAVDYLVTDPDLDAKRIAVVGHSRLGKTALLAAALDERIALAIPHQAGCGGTAPSRGKVGESVKQINDRFPHWFNDVFKQFNEQPDRLPFDQNSLVALVAPRPVLFTNAVEDTWANPDGQFEVLAAADPVYRFLGSEGLGARTVPEPGKLLDSRLGYFIRPGKHSMTREDWRVFLDFADKHLGK